MAAIESWCCASFYQNPATKDEKQTNPSYRNKQDPPGR
jgi:hypothetical protein